MLVTRKIRHPEDREFGKELTMDEFVTACHQELSEKSFQQKTFAITAPDKDSLELTRLNDSLFSTEGLSPDIKISFRDIKKIFDQLISITTNPSKVAELLKDLDKELGEAMRQHNIQFSDNDLPDYVIAGAGHYIPGPPPEHYHPKKKARLLDELLLKREVQKGVNVEGDSPKFAGFVDSESADPFVAAGHVFTEDKQVSRLLLHGSLSHRIMFDAIWKAKELGQLDLTYGDGKELTAPQLLDLLVHAKQYKSLAEFVLEENGPSLWSLAFDTTADSKSAPNAEQDYLNDDYYSFSCRNPFVLNSLLLNFGKELELSNLQHYLLDSHWKAAYEMVLRVKDSMPSMDIPDSTIYTYCMEVMTKAHKNIGAVGVKLPFTITESEAEADPSYAPFNSEDPIAGIVKKAKKKYESGEYASWEEFFAQVRYRILANAFQAKDKDVCEKLIKAGVDFFTSKVDSSDTASNTLFDELCETQAKYNIEQLQKEIYSTDWGNKYTGRRIFNPTKRINERVPTTVALEIDEINKAGKDGKSYYSTWKRIVELRQEAAKHNEDFTRFFRERPAKKHYEAANDAVILPLKKAGLV